MTLAVDEISDRGRTKTLILAQLRRRGVLGQKRATNAPATGAQRLALGIDGVVYSPELGLLVDDHHCVGKERRLAHILRAGGPGSTGPPAFFPDICILAEACQDGYDPILYRAYRDVFPPRHKFSGELVNPPSVGGGLHPPEDFWYADLVVYQPGTLPDGEPFRSTGHWNAAAQLEIFQTLTGQVLMIMGGHDLGSRPYARYQICRAGDIAVVPFSAWHLTYCLDGPAVVFNLYTDILSIPGAHSSRAAAHAEELKYRTDRPLELAAVRSGNGIRFVGDAASRLADQTSPRRIPTPQWIGPFLKPHSVLADLYLYAATADLSLLVQAALKAHASGHPSNTNRSSHAQPKGMPVR